MQCSLKKLTFIQLSLIFIKSFCNYYHWYEGGRCRVVFGLQYCYFFLKSLFSRTFTFTDIISNVFPWFAIRWMTGIFGRADMLQHPVIENFQQACVRIQYIFRQRLYQGPTESFHFMAHDPKNIFTRIKV